MTGTACEHQREALRTIVPGPRLGTAVLRLPEEGADGRSPAQAPRHPPAGPAPAPPDDPIR